MAPHPSVPTTPSPVFLHIGKSAQVALWAGFVVFLVTTLFVITIAARLHIKHRALHLITLVTTGIYTVRPFTTSARLCWNVECWQLNYFAMATGSGWSYVSVGLHQVQGVETQVFRQVFWARSASITWTMHPTHRSHVDLSMGCWWRLFCCWTLPCFRVFPGLTSWLSWSSREL